MQEKVLTSTFALGETRTHEIDLTVVGTRTTYYQATGDAGILWTYDVPLTALFVFFYWLAKLNFQKTRDKK